MYSNGWDKQTPYMTLICDHYLRAKMIRRVFKCHLEVVQMRIEFHYLDLIRSYGEEDKETFTDPRI